MSKISKAERSTISLIIVGLIIYLILLFFEIPTIFNRNTHIFIHSLIETASIIITGVIFVYGWLTWSFTKSRILIFISVSFLSIVILDLFHTLLFDVLQFSANSQSAPWFWVIGRLTTIIILLIVFYLIKSDRLYSTSASERLILVVCSSLYSFMISFFIIRYVDSFPLLINQEYEPTILKNIIEYFIAFFYSVAFIYVLRNYLKERNEFYLSLLLSFYFLILCSLTVNIFKDIYDSIFIFVHLFKILSFYYMFRAFYVTNIKVQFEEKMSAEEQLLDAKFELKNILLQNQGIVLKFVKKGDQFIHTLCDGKLLNDLNLTQEQIIGHSVYNFLRKEAADICNRECERVWQEGVDSKFELEIYDGVHLLMTVTKVTPIGKPAELIGNVVDITELKQAEALLRKTEKLTIVGELAAGFAHEIRNPLTTIKGFLQIMDQQKNNENEKYIEIMLAEIDRLEMITSEFMVVAKPEVVKYQTIDLTKIIEDVIQFLAPQALLVSVQIFFKTDKNHINVYGDEHHLKQVLINIYKNAMDAMPTGGDIVTQLTIEDDFVAIAIIDEGCGIPEELMPRLGEPFYTLKEKGTGLGLMVSYKIIEAHKGKLEITSNVNVGTTVTIKLPKSS